MELSAVLTKLPNIGASGWIRNWDVALGTFDMVTDFAYDIAVGNTFYAFHGCAQDRPACISFDNKDRYPGYDFVVR
jgi:hypothetical protein